MILTEAEATKKVCPFASAFNGHLNGANPRCVASNCMAWDWIDHEEEILYDGNHKGDFEAIYGSSSFPYYATAKDAAEQLPVLDARAAALGWSLRPNVMQQVGMRYARPKLDRKGECQRAVKVGTV